MYVSAYVEVNIICMVISAVIFFLINQNRTTSFAIKKTLVIGLWILCISDIAAILLRGQMFEGARTWIMISNLVYDLMISVLPFVWLILVAHRLGFVPNNWQKALLTLPLVACIVFVAMTPFTGFLFTINNQNEYVRGPGLFVSWILIWFYIVVSGVAALVAIAKEKRPAKKQEYYSLVYLLVLPVIGSLCQMFFYGVTANQVGITMMLILMTFKDQSDQITKDQLTGINNRNALFDYVHYVVRRNPNKETMVMMIDIDSFKAINDDFGHDVGDSALVDFAEILKESALKNRGRLFICRYGGDEFVVIGQNCDYVIANELKEAIKLASEKLNKDGKRPYKLSFSVGVSVGCLANEEAFSEALQVADAGMYEEKKALRGEIQKEIE